MNLGDSKRIASRRELARPRNRCLGVLGCDSEALLQAVRCWGCGECDSEALLQAVRCLGCGECDSEGIE